MRTTLSIDDDVLLAAKAIAQQQRCSIGEVVSELARRALVRPETAVTRGGIPLLPGRSGRPMVTLEIVNALRDELP
jgi:hypothetical protein